MAPNDNRKLSNALMKCMTIKTCTGIYPELAKTIPEFYRNAPADGIELTVTYVDTLMDDDDDDETSSPEKVVVAVHGLPGNVTHFDKLIEFYRHRTPTVRVIVPNMPDFAHTRQTGVFWNSTKEKACFLRDFLRRLNVRTVDCLVSHSFGVQTIAAIWEEPGELQIKSVAMFSPQPLWDLKEGEIQRIRGAFRFKSEWWYRLLSLFKVYKYPYTPLRLTNINEFLTLCTVAVDENVPTEIERRIDFLVKKLDIPVVLLYGAGERLISARAIAKLNERLGVAPDQIVRIDPDNGNDNDDGNEMSLSSSVQLTRRINSFVIENGGHFVHANYHKYSNALIDNLLNFKQYHNDNQDDDEPAARQQDA